MPPPSPHMSAMALVTIKLRHVDWRNGRPFFKPGPALRRLGFDAKPLRNAETGEWMSLDEARQWVERLEPEIARRREAHPSPLAGEGPREGAHLYTLGHLFADWFASPHFADGTTRGRRAEAALAPATQRDYRGKAHALELFDQDLWALPPDKLELPILYGLYERLWEAKGLSMARGMIAVLSAALTWGMQRGKVNLTQNPVRQMRMKTPDPRLRVGEIAEMKALVAAADAVGCPEIGDAIVLGLWTGQRQNDRLQLVDEGLVNGRRVFRQSKTGAVVAIREAPELEARLVARRARRRAWKVQPVENLVIMDERRQQLFKPDHYRKLYADIRSVAATGVLSLRLRRRVFGPANEDAKMNVEPVPSLADFRDQDLRDTAVTWMALGGATIPEIIAVTGHTAQSAHSILKHYLARHPEMADAAIGKMVDWYARSGG